VFETKIGKENEKKTTRTHQPASVTLALTHFVLFDERTFFANFLYYFFLISFFRFSFVFQYRQRYFLLA